MFYVVYAGLFCEVPVFAGYGAGLQIEEGGETADWGCGEGADGDVGSYVTGKQRTEWMEWHFEYLN